MLDLNKLLIDHKDDTPCGENLEYDALLLEVREAIEGKPEQQIGEGKNKSIIEGEEPDWKLVKKNCLVLCEKTHNLEVVVSLTRALMRLDGYEGLADGSALLAGVVEKFWECVHPQLDPDDNDPIERLNILAIFEDFNYLLSLQKIELIHSKGVGGVSLFDIRHAKGNNNEDDSIQKGKLIDAVFKSSTSESKDKLFSCLEQCATNFGKITFLLKEQAHIGAENAPVFSELLKIINESKGTVGAHLDHPNDATVVDGGESQMNTETTALVSNKLRNNGINRREDVISAIQEIEDYYSKNEPGSPIPLLLQRARGLVDKDFISLMEDLAPDSITQVELVLGNSRS